MDIGIEKITAVWYRKVSSWTSSILALVSMENVGESGRLENGNSAGFVQEFYMPGTNIRGNPYSRECGLSFHLKHTRVSGLCCAKPDLLNAVQLMPGTVGFLLSVRSKITLRFECELTTSLQLI